MTTLEAIEMGLAVVKALSPLAPGNAGVIAGELATIAQAVVDASQGLAENDLSKLAYLTLALQAENDALAAQVAAS